MKSKGRLESMRFCNVLLCLMLALICANTAMAQDMWRSERPGAAAAGSSPVWHSQEGQPEPQQSYRIGVGDLLQIEVYDEPDLTREVRVLTDGNISFPLLGSIKTEALTVKELETLITNKLAAEFLVNPQVTVFVKEFSNVYVFGEVRNPGSFPIFGRLTVFEAITLAGGFTEVANPSNVKIIRHQAGREFNFEVDISQLTKKGDTSQDAELQANDRVIVQRSFF